ncbi:Ricin B lectin domain [Trinorchestia longiramus]|nr:Ricin B lectin domain [Trinorchestia longiramus]
MIRLPNDPIKENYRTAVCPLIDVISWDSFAYRPQDDGARGGFDWHFYYKRIPLSSDLSSQLPKPFPNPVMNGGLFAISKTFFWELGGYDPQLAIWGGEQYNLSFKIWQCGGRMLDAPCSRVGHVFRGTPSSRPAAKGKGDFIGKNYKRVALVWMDEYIEALYRKKPSMRLLDAGDVTSELALREKLQCKPFSWFLKTVAPDLVKLYPPFEDPDFANGTIKNIATGTCMDTGGKQTGNLITSTCHGSTTQQFAWCWRKFIRIPNDQFCIESGASVGRSPVLYNCNNNNSPAKQRWTYNPDTKLLTDDATHRCVEAVAGGALQMSDCSEHNPHQQWLYQNLNMARIREVFPHLKAR